MDISVFTGLAKTPQPEDLRLPLAGTLKHWDEIRDFVINYYPATKEEWFVSV